MGPFFLFWSLMNLLFERAVKRAWRMGKTITHAKRVVIRWERLFGRRVS